MGAKLSFFLLCCYLFVADDVIAQTRTIVGHVIDSVSQLPLEGATISVIGTTKSVVTTNEGRYAIDISSNKDKLRVSYIGYLPAEIEVDGRSVIDISLVSEGQALEEVVIVAYGEQKKESVTAAISSVSTKDIVSSPTANISNSLVGRLSGVTAVQSRGEPGRDASTLKIRGIGTLTSGAESDPLVVVDGVPRGFDVMNQLDPNEIEKVTILKDASATAVFGVRGANGVILVTTRQGNRGVPQINFTSGTAFQVPTKLPALLNSYEYASLKNEGLLNDGLPEIFTADDLDRFKNGTAPVFYSDINWMDEFFKPVSIQQQYNLNVSGGNDIVRYFTSAGYFDQDGSYKTGNFDYGFDPNPKYRRFNFR